MNERQKQYRKNERKLSIIVLFLLFSGLCFFGLIVGGIFAGFNANWLTLLPYLLVPSLIFPVSLIIFLKNYKVLKEGGLNRDKLEPCCYIYPELTYEGIISKLGAYFSCDFITLMDDNDIKSAYSLIKHELHYRIMLLYVPELTRETRDTLFKRLNKKINKDPNYNVEVKAKGNCNHVRINFFIVKELNDYTNNLITTNACVMMRRVEAILNIFYCYSDRTLYIPAHYGVDNGAKYYKMHQAIISSL